MAGLAEGVAARVSAKFYADADITPGVAAISSSALGASGAQVMRRVGSTLTLTKDTYQSNEVRTDRQVSDFRHGVKRAPGTLGGELSPGTYARLFEASMRGTFAGAVTASNTDFTSVTADNATSKFIFTAGTPITKGLRVGMALRFSGLGLPANNNKNFVIVGFGGTSGREVTVFPAPTTMTTQSAFTLTTVGRSLIIPSTGHVKRKIAVEHYHIDKAYAELFVEGRVGGFNVQLPASGMSTVDFELLCRDMETYSGGQAPFFTSPTDVSTTGIMAAVNGMLRVGGDVVAVITGLNIQHQMDLSGDPVVGSNLLPDILAGRSIVSGQMTANFQDATLINAFRNESEIDILAYLTTTSAENTPAMTFYLPRVKLGGASKPLQGEGAQTITLPFQALKFEGAEATVGKANTTLQIWDSEVTA